MVRYILVAHNFFVQGNGFSVKELDVKDEEEAYNQMYAYVGRKQDTFNHVEATIIKIRENETIKPRKLTWKERFTGNIERTVL